MAVVEMGGGTSLIGRRGRTMATVVDERGWRSPAGFCGKTTAKGAAAIVMWTSAAILAFSMLSACHPKTADDDMAAGDQAVKANKLPEAEADYQSAENAAPSDP